MDLPKVTQHSQDSISVRLALLPIAVSLSELLPTGKGLRSTASAQGQGTCLQGVFGSSSPIPHPKVPLSGPALVATCPAPQAHCPLVAKPV